MNDRYHDHRIRSIRVACTKLCSHTIPNGSEIEVNFWSIYLQIGRTRHLELCLRAHRGEQIGYFVERVHEGRDLPRHVQAHWDFEPVERMYVPHIAALLRRYDRMRERRVGVRNGFGIWVYAIIRDMCNRRYLRNRYAAPIIRDAILHLYYPNGQIESRDIPEQEFQYEVGIEQPLLRWGRWGEDDTSSALWRSG